MARDDERKSRIDRDGVRTSKQPASGGLVGKIIAAMAFVALVVLAWMARQADAPSKGVAVTDEKRAPAVAPTTEQSAEWASVKKMTPRRAPERVKAEPAADAPLPEIDARDVIPALIAAGEKGGIAAFPPPGTDPPKRGIVVPDDYELPEGYVRHYQSTDDGKPLEPILMFSPDYEFLDQSGKRIALPDDLVVPPELAPPGLPIRTLDVPDPHTEQNR
jgi:hypothetical protein